MPLLFNSVKTFVEQVQRRRTHKSNPLQLDTVECIFTGPDGTVTTSVPGDLAQHPEYTGMRCTSWDIVRQVAECAEYRAQYTGKLNAGSGPYVGPPLIKRSRHLGEVSYSTSASVTSTQIKTTGFTVRFTAFGVTFTYLSNRLPAANFAGNFAGPAGAYLGTDNLTQFQTGLSYATGAPTFDAGLGYGGYISTTLVWSNDLTDVQVDDQGNGWWQISEIFLTQPHLNTFQH
jgi:hypothetical protein